MSTWIKICGITNLEDAQLAARLGADALGFVMHKKSPRCCQPVLAREIIQAVPTGVECVGVWLDEPADLISAEAAFIGCAAIQAYEWPTLVELAARNLACIPAVGSGREFLEEPWDALLMRFQTHEFNRFILDSSRHEPAELNGSRPETNGGQFFMESVWRGILPVLAGGLHAGNVYETLADNGPCGIDVASGIESRPGKKDHAKLKHFIEEVRRWDMTVSSAATAVDSSRKR